MPSRHGSSNYRPRVSLRLAADRYGAAMGSERHGPWTWHSMNRLLDGDRFRAFTDEVTDPAGRFGTFDWIEVPDQVRVAALTADGQIYVVREYQYLPRRVIWQLPGGDIGRLEEPATAAVRTAAQVGVAAGRWRLQGVVWPLPALTPARVHLWLAEDLQPGVEASAAAPMPLADAVAAVLDGTVGCAASAQLILAVAAG